MIKKDYQIKSKTKAEEIQKEVSKDPSKFGEIAKKESMDKSSAKKMVPLVM